MKKPVPEIKHMHRLVSEKPQYAAAPHIGYSPDSEKPLQEPGARDCEKNPGAYIKTIIKE